MPFAAAAAARTVHCPHDSGGDDLDVRLNWRPPPASTEPLYDSISTTFGRAPRHGWGADFMQAARFFDLHLEQLFDGDNVIEFIPPQVDGELVWAEILKLGQEE